MPRTIILSHASGDEHFTIETSDEASNVLSARSGSGNESEVQSSNSEANFPRSRRRESIESEGRFTPRVSQNLQSSNADGVDPLYPFILPQNNDRHTQDQPWTRQHTLYGSHHPSMVQTPTLRPNLYPIPRASPSRTYAPYDHSANPQEASPRSLPNSPIYSQSSSQNVGFDRESASPSVNSRSPSPQIHAVTKIHSDTEEAGPPKGILKRGFHLATTRNQPRFKKKARVFFEITGKSYQNENELEETLEPVTTKSDHAFPQLELAAIFAAKKTVTIDKDVGIQLDCIDLTTSLTEETLKPHFRWLHLPERDMNLDIFRKLAMQYAKLVPGMTEPCGILFKRLQGQHLLEGGNGLTVKPGTVDRAFRRASDENGTSPLSATFFSFPFFETGPKRPFRHGWSSNRRDGTHLTKTLLEMLYPYESTESRDAQQAYSKYFTKNEVLYVPQLWALTLGSDYLITSSTQCVQDLWGKNITKRTIGSNFFSKGPTLLRIKDPLDRLHTLSLESNPTFFEIEQYLSSDCMKGTGIPIDTCNIRFKNEAPFTSSNWLNLLRSADTPVIEIEITRTAKNSSEPDKVANKSEHVRTTRIGSQALVLYNPRKGLERHSSGVVNSTLNGQHTILPSQSAMLQDSPAKVFEARSKPLARPMSNILGVPFDEDALNLDAKHEQPAIPSVADRRVQALSTQSPAAHRRRRPITINHSSGTEQFSISDDEQIGVSLHHRSRVSSEEDDFSSCEDDDEDNDSWEHLQQPSDDIYPSDSASRPARRDSTAYFYHLHPSSARVAPRRSTRRHPVPQRDLVDKSGKQRIVQGSNENLAALEVSAAPRLWTLDHNGVRTPRENTEEPSNIEVVIGKHWAESSEVSLSDTSRPIQNRIWMLDDELAPQTDTEAHQRVNIPMAKGLLGSENEVPDTRITQRTATPKRGLDNQDNLDYVQNHIRRMEEDSRGRARLQPPSSQLLGEHVSPARPPESSPAPPIPRNVVPGTDGPCVDEEKNKKLIPSSQFEDQNNRFKSSAKDIPINERLAARILDSSPVPSTPVLTLGYVGHPTKKENFALESTHDAEQAEGDGEVRDEIKVVVDTALGEHEQDLQSRPRRLQPTVEDADDEAYNLYPGLRQEQWPEDHIPISPVPFLLPPELEPKSSSEAHPTKNYPLTSPRGRQVRNNGKGRPTLDVDEGDFEYSSTTTSSASEYVVDGYLPGTDRTHVGAHISQDSSHHHNHDRRNGPRTNLGRKQMRSRTRGTTRGMDRSQHINSPTRTSRRNLPSLPQRKAAESKGRATNNTSKRTRSEKSSKFSTILDANDHPYSRYHEVRVDHVANMQRILYKDLYSKGLDAPHSDRLNPFLPSFRPGPQLVSPKSPSLPPVDPFTTFTFQQPDPSWNSGFPPFTGYSSFDPTYNSSSGIRSHLPPPPPPPCPPPPPTRPMPPPFAQQGISSEYQESLSSTATTVDQDIKEELKSMQRSRGTPAGGPQENPRTDVPPFLAWTPWQSKTQRTSKEHVPTETNEVLDFILQDINRRLLIGEKDTRIYSSNAPVLFEQLDFAALESAHPATLASDLFSLSELANGLETETFLYSQFSELKILAWEVCLAFLRQVKLFAPLDYDHAVLSRCWGALQSISTIVLESMSVKPQNSQTQGVWVVRRIENEDSILARYGLERPSPPILECPDCHRGTAYQAEEDGLRHLWEQHFRPSSKAAYDGSSRLARDLKTWLRSEDQLRVELRISVLTSILEMFLHHLKKNFGRASHIRDGVAGPSDDYKSLALPVSLPSYFEHEVSCLMWTSKTADLIKKYLDKWHYEGGPAGLAIREEPFLVNVNAQLVRFLTKAEDKLQDAEHELMLMARSSPTAISVGLAAVGPEYLLVFLVEQLRTRRFQHSLDTTGLYRRTMDKLTYQINTSPCKRLMRDIHSVQEEVNSLILINDFQAEFYDELMRTLDPGQDSGQDAIPDRARTLMFFSHELPYLNVASSRIKANSQHLKGMQDSLHSMREQVKQNIEIQDEDHGKAIYVFTTVTIVFLPLSFVTSFFGMNTVDIRDIESSQSIFWSTGLPLTLVVVVFALLIAYRGDQIHNAAMHFWRTWVSGYMPSHDHDIASQGQRNKQPLRIVNPPLKSAFNGYFRGQEQDQIPTHTNLRRRDTDRSLTYSIS